MVYCELHFVNNLNAMIKSEVNGTQDEKQDGVHYSSLRIVQAKLFMAGLIRCQIIFNCTRDDQQRGRRCEPAEQPVHTFLIVNWVL